MAKRKLKLKNAKPEEYFILVTGVPLKNLKELGNALDTMNEWVYNHHVNDSRNDFKAWVENALKELKLAEELTTANNKKEMELMIFKHIINNYL